MAVATNIPIACSLDGASLEDCLAAWRSLRARAASDTALAPTVHRLSFAPGTIDLGDIASLVQAELDCCPFFRFTIGVDASAVTLDIDAPPEASATMADFRRATATPR